jgi:hypothetical protein
MRGLHSYLQKLVWCYVRPRSYYRRARAKGTPLLPGSHGLYIRATLPPAHSPSHHYASTNLVARLFITSILRRRAGQLSKNSEHLRAAPADAGGRKAPGESRGAPKDFENGRTWNAQHFRNLASTQSLLAQRHDMVAVRIHTMRSPDCVVKA